MHLRNFPHVYIKGDERRLAYYTVEARELKEDGWVKEGEAPTNVEPEADETEPEETDFVPEPLVGDPDFEAMTKRDLLQYAKDRGVELLDTALKAELVEACKAL